MIHRDVRAVLSIGMHWGTFLLANEPLDQAITDLVLRERSWVCGTTLMVRR